jgi:hypothetical protein
LLQVAALMDWMGATIAKHPCMLFQSCALFIQGMLYYSQGHIQVRLPTPPFDYLAASQVSATHFLIVTTLERSSETR